MEKILEKSGKFVSPEMWEPWWLINSVECFSVVRVHNVDWFNFAPIKWYFTVAQVFLTVLTSFIFP